MLDQTCYKTFEEWFHFLKPIFPTLQLFNKSHTTNVFVKFVYKLIQVNQLLADQ